MSNNSSHSGSVRSSPVPSEGGGSNGERPSVVITSVQNSSPIVSGNVRVKQEPVDRPAIGNIQTRSQPDSQSADGDNGLRQRNNLVNSKENNASASARGMEHNVEALSLGTPKTTTKNKGYVHSMTIPYLTC